ncbi:MAG: diacylglycerol/lipid kinase family protein [Chitinophagales bacterium]
MSSNTWAIIINPQSGAGKTKKKWKQISAELEAMEVDYTLHWTESPEHAIEVARQCRATGYTKFFAIGGDGTIQEVVNGVLAQGYSDEFVFGALPMGTGNDWMRQYITKASIADYLSALKGKNLFEQDLGLVQSESGKSRYFINFFGAGFDSQVILESVKYKKWGAVAYEMGLLSALWNYNSPMGKISMNDQILYQGRLYMMIASIGRYAGGGMQLCPAAVNNDGILDLTYIEHLGKLNVIANTRRLKTGSIIHHSKVHTHRGTSFIIENKSTLEQTALRGEIDGEYFGDGPFTVTLAPFPFRLSLPVSGS